MPLITATAVRKEPTPPPIEKVVVELDPAVAEWLANRLWYRGIGAAPTIRLKYHLLAREIATALGKEPDRCITAVWGGDFT